jgi:Flp pilus assembly pilin Flp
MNNRRLTSLPGLLAIDDTGSAAIEYAVLTGLIAVALVSAVSGPGDYLVTVSDYVASELARD